VAEYCEEADLADLVTLAAAVGQRPSQLLGLEWSDIELDVKRVRTSGKVIRIRGVGLVRVVIANDPKNPGGTVALISRLRCCGGERRCWRLGGWRHRRWVRRR